MAERLFLDERNLRDIGLHEPNIQTIRKLCEFVDLITRVDDAEGDILLKQPLDATLTALAGLGATAGLIEKTALNTFTERAIGVAAGTSIPTRDDADTRYANISGDTFTGAIQATEYRVSGTKVLGAQGAAVADAAGGATIDAEARTALNALLARLRTHGTIAT